MKNKSLRIEYRVMKMPYGIQMPLYSADTEAECENWIEEHTPADLMGDVGYIIQKVFTTSRKKR